MKIDWDYYIKRKRIDIKQWLNKYNVTNYNELEKRVELMGISTPSRLQMIRFFKKSNSKSAQKSEKQNDAEDFQKVQEGTDPVHTKTKTNSSSGNTKPTKRNRSKKS